jgi:hypothetical protein
MNPIDSFNEYVISISDYLLFYKLLKISNDLNLSFLNHIYLNDDLVLSLRYLKCFIDEINSFFNFHEFDFIFLYS